MIKCNNTLYANPLINNKHKKKSKNNGFLVHRSHMTHAGKTLSDFGNRNNIPYKLKYVHVYVTNEIMFNAFPFLGIWNVLKPVRLNAGKRVSDFFVMS